MSAAWAIARTPAETDLPRTSAVRDDAQLKLWLREQAALAREQEREEAMLERFGDFF